MKRSIIAIIMIIVVMLGAIYFFFKIDKEKSCHETAYWSAYNDIADPKIDQKKYDEYLKECLNKK